MYTGGLPLILEHRALKPLGVIFCKLMRYPVETSDSFRMGAGHQKSNYMIRGLETVSPTPPKLWGGQRG